MKVKCEVCGKKFKKLGNHMKFKHPPLSPAPPIGQAEEEEEDARDKVIVKLINLLWATLTVDQKVEALNSLSL